MSRHPLPIRYLRLAEQDLYDIHDYISRDAPETADGFLDELDERIRQLADHPKLGPPLREPRLRELGYRYLTIGRYIAFYKADGDQVVIYRVLHSPRGWTRLL